MPSGDVLDGFIRNVDALVDVAVQEEALSTDWEDVADGGDFCQSSAPARQPSAGIDGVDPRAEGLLHVNQFHAARDDARLDELSADVV